MARILPFRKRREEPVHRRTQTITASAATLNLASKSEARRVRMLRQGWQEDAWAYRDAIGEVSYAHRFIANCASRMRIFAAAYPADDYDAEPIALDDPEAQVPPDLVQAAQSAMSALGSGRVAMANMMRMLSENLSVAGEAFLHGQTDPGTGVDTWIVRSIDEVMIRDDKYQLREVPLDPQGVFGWVPLDMENNYLARIWTPHPRFKLLADSSMRGVLDSCEELMILSRMIRATGRSRLAGAGILKVPDGLSAQSATDDDEDPQADKFLGVLADTMMAPIADEGVASSVVPILVRGAPDALNALQHLSLDRPLDPVMAAQRQELIGRIATGIDLPKEVLMGMIDLNHWTAWQVDDNTFRHHIETHVINCVDALTVGYLRMELAVLGFDPELIGRIVVWYDPVELVTHPDRTQDAIALYNLRELSGQSLRKATGFDEGDKPTDMEMVVRAISGERNWPPNAALAILARLDPTLSFPPITTAGTFPGIKAGAVDAEALPVAPGAPLPGAVTAPPSPASAVPPAAPGAEANTTPPPGNAPGSAPPKPLSASGNREAEQLSRRLAKIDADLRNRLQVAATAAVARVLDRAGAKLRTSVKRDARLSRAITGVDNRHVAHTLGTAVVEALGLNAPELLTTDWTDLKVSYDAWLSSSIAATVSTAAKLAGDDVTSEKAKRLKAKLTAQAEAGWRLMEAALAARTAKLLYEPEPTDTGPVYGNAGKDVLVSPSTIRGVLAVAGGMATQSPATALTSDLAATTEPVGQISTGDSVTSYLEDAGTETAGYEWIHGSPLKPFEPHEDLDGTQFTDWTDDALTNGDDWPPVPYFVPGDHEGCTCDYLVLWEPGESSSEGGDVSVYDTGNEPVIRDDSGEVVIPEGSREPSPVYAPGEGPEG